MQELANTAFDAAMKRDVPMQAAKNTSPIEDAHRFADDRLDRLEHVLGDLNAQVMRLGSKLSPVLTRGAWDDNQDAIPGLDGGTPEDDRSTVARGFSQLGERADRYAGIVNEIRRRVEAIEDSIEL